MKPAAVILYGCAIEWLGAILVYCSDFARPAFVVGTGIMFLGFGAIAIGSLLVKDKP